MKLSVTPARAAILLFSAATIYGCSAPQVTQKWLDKNCSSITGFVPDQCESIKGCVTRPNGCACKFDNGNRYVGEIYNTKLHGYGEFFWTSGAEYKGYWQFDKKHCGVEISGANYAVFKNGSVSERGNTDDQTAGLIGAAILIGVAAALAEGGGGGGAPSCYGYAWDYQPGNGQYACRCTGGSAGGQYANAQNCAGQPFIDNWP